MGATADGRHRRSRESRGRIIDAMLELVREGVLEPTAEQVSERAGLAMRTVFRHFRDMESLYREISQRMHTRIEAMIEGETRAEPWQAGLHRMVDRRARIYEEMLPMRLAADALRHRSRVLQDDHAEFVEVARGMLRDLLPREIARDKVRFEALDALLSYELWIRLRRHQKLSAGSARTVIHRSVEAVLTQPG